MTPEDLKRLLSIREERENKARRALEAALRAKRQAQATFDQAYQHFLGGRQELLNYVGSRRDEMIAEGASVSAFENHKQVVKRMEEDVVGRLRKAKELKGEVDKADEFLKAEREKFSQANRDKVRMENLEEMILEEIAREEDRAEEQEIEEVAGDRRAPPGLEPQ